MTRKPLHPTSPAMALNLSFSLLILFFFFINTPQLATAQAVETSVVVETISMPAASTITQTATSEAAAADASSSPTDISSTYTTPTLFKSTVLNTTNFYRYLHSAPVLSYNTSLSDFAQSYSSECTWSHNPTLSSFNYGENLARGYANLTAAIDAWYDEVWQFDYDFDSTDPTGWTEETGHFTQLVWRDSRSVGCGWTDCEGKNGVDGVLVVCNYWPAGNVLMAGRGSAAKELFVQNVLPERSGGAQGWDAVQADAEAGVRTDTGDSSGGGGGNGSQGSDAPPVLVGGAGIAMGMLLSLLAVAVFFIEYV